MDGERWNDSNDAGQYANLKPAVPAAPQRRLRQHFDRNDAQNHQDTSGGEKPEKPRPARGSISAAFFKYAAA